MPTAESNPGSPPPASPETDSTQTDSTALPSAWQPLTFRGIGAFSRAKLGRLFLVQFLVALVVAGSVVWFLAVHWFPTLREAIHQLPETGSIQGGQLSTLRATTTPLVETRYLAIAVDAADTGIASSLADFRLEFHKSEIAICAFAGCLTRPYPRESIIQFNQPELESWWGAWQPMLFILVPLAVVVWLFASWLTLATIYFPVAWLIAYFKDRRLTGRGAWKLGGAALLPGALLSAFGIVLYGLGLADLLQMICIWVAHIPVGWFFLVMATLRLPREGMPAASNPFGSRRSKGKSPFAKSGA